MGTLDGGIQRVRVYTQNPAGRKPVRNSCVRFETSKHFWVVGVMIVIIHDII